MKRRPKKRQKQTKGVSLANKLLKLAETHEEKELYKLICQYTQDLVQGAGCSIFRVNPRTDKLVMVESTTIPQSLWNRATYERGEGKTGWVFKYGRFLYIPDENDKKYLQSIKPEPPTSSGRHKPRETTGGEIGPFMAAPIMSENFVIGVIRTPALPGKKKFTSIEQKMFKSFAEKLSEVIVNTILIEKRKRLVHAYARIGKATNVDDLLDEIVEDITYVVGGAAARSSYLKAIGIDRAIGSLD